MTCKKQPRPQGHKRPQTRRGAAAVELAVCLPLLFGIALASIELANGIYLKQVLTQAAYEAARTATANGGLQADATARANAVFTARGVNSGAVSYSPTVTASTAAGTEISVTATAPTTGNFYVPTRWFGNSTITVVVRMIRL